MNVYIYIFRHVQSRFVSVSDCLNIPDWSSLGEFKTDFGGADIFHVACVNTIDTSYAEILNMNDLLIAQNKSTDPLEDLDILLDELNFEYKNEVSPSKENNVINIATKQLQTYTQYWDSVFALKQKKNITLNPS